MRKRNLYIVILIIGFLLGYFNQHITVFFLDKDTYIGFLFSYSLFISFLYFYIREKLSKERFINSNYDSDNWHLKVENKSLKDKKNELHNENFKLKQSIESLNAYATSLNNKIYNLTDKNKKKK